jgi:hypothetical protein
MRKTPLGCENSLKLMFVVTEADKAENAMRLLRRWHISLAHQFHADGTATSETLNIFGLGGTAKTMSVCVVPGFLSQEFLREAEETLKLKKRGAGIAFTAPISGIASQAANLINDGYSRQQTRGDERIESGLDEPKEEKKENGLALSLIVASVAQGYGQTAAAAAREAGATGGTLWNARKAETEAHSSALGLAINGEREILTILAPKFIKIDIMKAINTACGINTEARGIVISLPVEAAVGLETRA